MENIIKKVTDRGIVDGHYTIPDGITEIGDRAFYGCKSLKKSVYRRGLLKLGIGLSTNAVVCRASVPEKLAYFP